MSRDLLWGLVLGLLLAWLVVVLVDLTLLERLRTAEAIAAHYGRLQ